MTALTNGHWDHSPRWNLEPCEAQRITVVFIKRFKTGMGNYTREWPKGLEIECVEVQTYAYVVNRGTQPDQHFLLYNEDGAGWYKVTHGGALALPHIQIPWEVVEIKEEDEG